MSDKEEDNTDQQTEQITKEPEQKPEKTKDPRKVEAGKRLAQYHKKAKQALEKEENKNENNNVEEYNSNSQWMPEISLTTGLTLVGITLTAVDLYLRWRKSDKPKQNLEIKQDKQIPKPPSKKIGME